MAVLAEFELRVLLSVLRAGDAAYAVAVHEALEQRTRRRASLGAVYITLDRLERKGLLSSRLGAPTAERGGRAKRYYRVTRAGTAAAREESRILRRLLDGLDALADER